MIASHPAFVAAKVPRIVPVRAQMEGGRIKHPSRGIVRRRTEEARRVVRDAGAEVVADPVVRHGGHGVVVVRVRVEKVRRRLRLLGLKVTRRDPVVVVMMMVMRVRRVAAVVMVMVGRPGRRRHAGLQVMRIAGHGGSVHEDRGEARLRVDGHRLHHSVLVGVMALPVHPGGVVHGMRHHPGIRQDGRHPVRGHDHMRTAVKVMVGEVVLVVDRMGHEGLVLRLPV